MIKGKPLTKKAFNLKNEAIAGGISAVVILLFYLMTAVIIPSRQLQAYPQLDSGIFSAVDIIREPMATLDGEWRFIDAHLLTDISQLDGMEVASHIKVTLPGKWNTYRNQSGVNPSFGYGTYFATVQIAEEQLGKVMAVRINNIGMSNKVFINGEFVGQGGNPAASREDYLMGNVPYTITFVPNKTELSIAIQVANFDYSPYSGIVSSIRFGDQQSISANIQRSIAYEIIFITSFVVVGIVYFVLALYRRTAKYLLYFALYNFTAVVYVLTHGEKLWYHLFPNFSYALFTKIQYFSAAVNLTFFLLYLLTSFPLLFNNRLTKGAIVLSYLFYPFILFPLSIQSQLSGPQILFFQIIMVYTVSRFILGIVQRHAFIWFISFSAFLSLYMVNEAVGVVLGTKDIGISIVAAQLLWVLIQAFLIAIRLSITFDLVDAQAQALIKMDKQKDEFLAKTSHEFKTPLHGIINMLKLFLEREGERLNLADQNRIQLVIESASRLSRLVNDLLDLSRIREGKVAIEQDWVELKHQLNNVIEVCEFAFTGRPCEITVTHALGDLEIFADRDRFRQILYNLIENAINYSDSGRVIITTDFVNEEAIIKIRDFGAGISEVVMDEIFKPFFQVQEDPRDFHMGLGLSIVKDLVEQLGGTIEVTSTDGMGSVFCLTFKARKLQIYGEGDPDDANQMSADDEMASQAAFIKAAQRIEKHRMDGAYTVVVVDDQATNRMVLEDALRDDGYTILSCNSGRAALEIIETTRPIDLIILDVMMPDYSGYEISDLIRNRYSLAELPILMITAGINMIDAERMLAIGANDFLYKPFQLSELRARVKSLLALKKAADKKSQLEIAFLNAQVNPHFLYNALNTIAAVCEDQSPEAADLIISLAKYLRGTLDFSYTQDLIPIEKEITLISAYLKLETARFPNLKVDYAIAGIDLKQLRIPPMALQVLVENAVKHGVRAIEKEGRILVVIKGEASTVKVFVEDNGIGFTEDAFNRLMSSDLSKETSSEESVGLINLNQRLKRMLGTELKWYPPTMNGTCIGFEVDLKGVAYDESPIGG